MSAKISDSVKIANLPENPTPERLAMAYVNTYVDDSHGDLGLAFVKFRLDGGQSVKVRITGLIHGLESYGMLWWTGEIVDSTGNAIQKVQSFYEYKPGNNGGFVRPIARG